MQSTPLSIDRLETRLAPLLLRSHPICKMCARVATLRLNARRRQVLCTQAERSTSRNPPKERDLLAATFQLVTSVTSENREETIL